MKTDNMINKKVLMIICILQYVRFICIKIHKNSNEFLVHFLLLISFAIEYCSLPNNSLVYYQTWYWINLEYVDFTAAEINLNEVIKIICQ